MSEILLYLGQSGVGKTTSLESLDPKKTIIVAPNSKGLPFQGWRKNYIEGKNIIRTNDLEKVYPLLKHVSDNMPEVNCVVLDDFFHFISARIFSPTFLARTDGNDAFAKWNELGSDVFNMLFSHAQDLRPDLYVVVMAHTAVNEAGKVTIKTAGKLLDNTIDIPSYFTYIIHGIIQESEAGPQYLVQTNWHSIYHAKTPRGCFSEMYIPNNMQYILDCINYYEYGPKTEAEAENQQV